MDAAELDRLRVLYRPTDAHTLAREVRALIRLGLTVEDVAASMRIPLSEVTRLRDLPEEA